MAQTLFGKRGTVPSRKMQADDNGVKLSDAEIRQAHPGYKGVPVGFQPTDLASRMNAAAKQGGGIQAGAHPEFDKPTPLEQIGTWVHSLFNHPNTQKGGQ